MELISKINEIKNSPIKEIIDNRIKEFEKKGKEKLDAVFGELCFCILTANFSAEKCIHIQNEIGRDFSILGKQELAEELKKHGHRFPKTRADYIYKARKCEKDLFNIIGNGKERREKLVKEIKGIGMKEASHFLRNIGFKDVAIIDFHIIDLLNRKGLIEFERKKQTLTKKKYLEIEKVLEEIGRKTGLNLAELDLYLWYIETGKILK
jgi:N-glycosylase/DNA lyase